MTYPENPKGMQNLGDQFTKKGRAADKLRESLASTGMSWFLDAQSERMRQERQWYLNLSFYYGSQYSQYRQGANGNFDLYTPKAPSYRVRVVINQTRKIIRKEISRLVAQKPNAFIIPASSEDKDVFAAQAGEQIWDSLWREQDFGRTLRKSVFWQSVCGNGFIKSFWDKTKIDPNNPQIYGDIAITNVTPFHIFVPDLAEEDIEDQPYVIHAQVRNNSWIRNNLKIEPGSSTKADTVDDALQSVMGLTRNGTKRDQTVILEIWVKPGYLPELPDGGMFTLCANQIIQGFAQLPYEHQQYPFTKLDGIPTGKFYNSSIIEDLIPLQMELNRSRSQLIESKNRMSKPQLVAQKGSVNPKMITTEPGLVIEYAMGFEPPQPLPLQNLPNYVTDEIQRLYDDMADISGQHEVSNGSTPPGVTAATAISFLQEQDESLIATAYDSIEEGIEKIAGQSLTYVKQFWDEPRIIKIVGIEGTFDVKTFEGADLNDNTDIRIEAGSALPTSRAAKQAFIMDLMKMGFIPPEKGLEMMEVGGINKIYEEIQIDKRQAQRENLKMQVITEEDLALHEQEWYAQSQPQAPLVEPQDPMQELMGAVDPSVAAPSPLDEVDTAPGQEQTVDPTIDPVSGLKLAPPPLVPVNTYDNHQIHIEVHNNYRKSQNFENVSPVVKRLFEEHVKQHMEALSGQMIHPMSGMDEFDPQAPSGDEEDMAMQELEANGQEAGTAQAPGPEAMPQTAEEAPVEGG